jgi:hypothetical protein
MIATHKQRLRFPAKIAIVNPQVILKEKYANSDEYSFYAETVIGDFYRIIPTTAREVEFFENCQKYSEIFAPATGNGVIVRADVIDTIDPPIKNLK